MESIYVLEKIEDMLDEVQGTDFVQHDEAVMEEIGEALGHVANAIDIIEKGKRQLSPWLKPGA